MASAAALASTIPIHDVAQSLSHFQLSASKPNSESVISNGHSLEEPTPSQAPNLTSAPAPRIFVYPNGGSAIPIFVEANGVSNNRPKLVKSLKRYGAEIVHDPANARIILVEPFSKEGRYFVREWQAEAGKSVLDIAWATASVESGRALLQEDQYGGFGNLSGENIKDDDDGLVGAGRNAEDLDDEELDIVEVEKSVTPVKSKRKREKEVSFVAGSGSVSSGRAMNSNGASITIASTRISPDYTASPSPAFSFPVSTGRSNTQHHISDRTHGLANLQRSAPEPKAMVMPEARRSTAHDMEHRPLIERKRSDFKTPGLPTPPGTSSATSVDFNNGHQYPGRAVASPSPSHHQQSSSSITYNQQQYPSYGPSPLQTYDVPSSSSQQYAQSQTLPQQHQPPLSQLSNQLTLMDRRTVSPGVSSELMQQQLAMFASMSPAVQQYFLMQMQGVQMPRALPAPPGFSAHGQAAPSTAPSWGSTSHLPSPTDQFGNFGTMQDFNYNALHQQMFQQATTSSSQMNGFAMSEPSPTQAHSLVQPFTPPPSSLHSSASSNLGRLHTPPLASFSLSSQEPDNEPETPPIAILERGRSSKGKKRSHEMIDAEDEPESEYEFSASHHSRKSSKRSRPKDVDSWTGPSASQLSPSQKKPPIGIFTAEDGSPMKFFYQLNSRDREGKRISHISKIKANGGVITSDMHDATYIILVPQSPLFFDPVKKECQAMNITALKSSFIDACLEEGGIVNEEEFILELKESSPVKKARGRPTTQSISFSRDKGGTDIPADIRDRLPTPPAPEFFPNGTNKHTDAERRFVLESAAIIFRKHPDITNKKLFAIIGERCSNHTEGSWKNKWSNSDDLEKVRYAVMAEEAPEDDDFDAEGEDVDDVQEISAPDREFTADELEADLQNITKYFAAEPAGSDEELWVGLAEKHECITATSWQEFYQNMHDEVNRRLRVALDLTE